MILEFPVSVFIRIADRLDGRSADEFSLVADVLADLGLLVTIGDDGSFQFETLLNAAKRRVVEELMKIGRKEKEE